MCFKLHLKLIYLMGLLNKNTNIQKIIAITQINNVNIKLKIVINF